ncbi:hypothetical protein V8E36_004157 [Tilletia maclaganii]
MQLQATTVALFSLVAVAVADYKSLTANLQDLDAAVTTLNDQLWASNVGTYGGGLKVDQTCKNLVKSLNSATSAAENESVFSATDSNLILNQVKNIYPDVKNTTTRVAALYPTLSRYRMAVTSIVKTNVNNLANATADFADALISIAASSTRSRASALASQYNAAMASAVAVYA